MTREEARNIVTNADLSKIPGDVIEAFFCLCISNGKEGEPYCNSNEAHRMAIKSLKEENTDDRHDVPSDEMTLEQAREFLQDRIRFIDENYPEAINYKKALKTAVRELGKQRCEDCISRQYVKEQMIKYGFHAPDMTVIEFVEGMPSVTPQKKVGQWIEGKYRDDDIRYNDSSYKCNKCGRIVDFKENYCPDCGRKMIQEVGK